MIIPDEECRKAFEVIIGQAPYDRDLERFDVEGTWPGDYKDHCVALAWDMWQAAWLARVPAGHVAVPMEPTKGIIAIMSECEGVNPPYTKLQAWKAMLAASQGDE